MKPFGESEESKSDFENIKYIQILADIELKQTSFNQKQK